MSASVLVGNDVVWLDDPVIQGHCMRSRWLERVLAADERERVARSPLPHVLAWSFFAAKEAAYKAASKLCAQVVLAHRRFVVSPRLDAVTYDGITLHLGLARGPGWVHARVSTTPTPLLGALRRPRAAFCQRAAVRALVREELGGHLGCPPEELEVRRDPCPERWDGQGPPYLTRRGQRVPLDLSLSHDGPFVAFAATPCASGVTP